MIHIPFYHFPDQPCTGFRIITSMPARKLIDIYQSERVAHIKKMFIGRIMGTDSIHIHFFNEQSILTTHGCTCSPSAVYRKRMPVDTFHNQAGSVQINTVLRKKLDGTESDPFFTNLNNVSAAVFQFQTRHIKFRSFGIPYFYIRPFACKLGFSAGGGKRTTDLLFALQCP